MIRRIFPYFIFFFCWTSFSSELSSSLDSKKKAENQSAREESDWELISPYTQVKRGEEFLVGVFIKVPPKWYTYWSFAGDFGQSSKMKWNQIENVRINSLPFPTPERKHFSIGAKEFHSFIYEKEVLIPVQVFIEEGYQKDELSLSLDLEWFICQDICFSRRSQKELRLKVAETFKFHAVNKQIFDFWQSSFPKKLSLKSYFETKDHQQVINFDFEKDIKCLDLFPKSSVDFGTKRPKVLSQSSMSCSFQVPASNSNLPKISGLLVYSEGGEKHSALFDSHQNKSFGLFWFILMAFLGGLILNIMPCVLPIIFLKFYNTLDLKHLPPRKIFTLNLSYVFGIICSFLFLAFFVFISKQMGENLGWGFHLQSPIFVTALALLFTLMGFYLLDMISFPSPKVSLLFKDEKIFSHFTTGVLATTAASPCTVPFMAPAMGFAFSRTYVEIFAIFFFLGLGLSFPYLVFSFFPKALKYIPGPGYWTELFKKLFSIPLFLTTLWLLKILYVQVQLKFFIFSLVVFPLLFLAVFLRLKISKASIRFWINLLFTALILLFFALQILFHQTKTKAVSIKPKKESLLFDSNWKLFNGNSDQVLFDKQNGKNIFIVFGAEWCLTCKFNERIFKRQEFQDLVQKYNIQLYYADWTNQDPEITKFLESYDHSGVPFYIFYKGEEKLHIFPSFLFPSAFYQELEELSQ